MAKTKPIQVKYLSLPLVGSEKRQKLTPWWKNFSKSSQRETSRIAGWMKFFLSLVPTERDQKLYLLRNFLPQYSLLTFLSEMEKLFSPPRGRARESFFYAFLSKIFNFWLRFGAIFTFVRLVAPKWSHFSSVASKLMPFSGLKFLCWH